MNTDQVMTAASNGFGLSWFDWILVALIALSTAMSLGRGFVREALSLGTWWQPLWWHAYFMLRWMRF